MLKKKKECSWGIYLFNFKAYYKVTINNNIVLLKTQTSSEKWNRDLDIDQYIYDRFVFYSCANVMQFNRKMRIFLTNGAGTTG